MTGQRSLTRNGTVWTQQQKIVAADGAALDNFGWSVAMSDSMEAFAVGSPASGGTGVVYLYA